MRAFAVSAAVAALVISACETLVGETPPASDPLTTSEADGDVPAPGKPVSDEPVGDVVVSRVPDTGPVGDRPVESYLGLSPADYFDRASAVAIRADETILADCNDVRSAVHVRTEALPPADILMQGMANGAAVLYRERFDVGGCGLARSHSIVPFVGEDGLARFEAFVPGDTATLLKLQMDTVRQTIATAVGTFAARYDEGACDPMSNAPWVVDTSIAQYPSGSGEWIETWTIVVCGDRHDLDITFTPTETSVRVSVSIPFAEG